MQQPTLEEKILRKSFKSNKPKGKCSIQKVSNLDIQTIFDDNDLNSLTMVKQKWNVGVFVFLLLIANVPSHFEHFVSGVLGLQMLSRRIFHLCQKKKPISQDAKLNKVYLRLKFAWKVENYRAELESMLLFF